MSPPDDDLTTWRDDPIVAALTAPGTDAELAGETDALAGFRAAVPIRSRRRFIGRLGVGGAAVSAAVIFSSGAAAAYTASLPRPVQDFISHVTNPLGLGVPAAQPARKAANSVPRRTAAPTSAPTAPPSVAPSPTVRPHVTASARAHHPAAPNRSPRPTASPTPVVSTTATATATASPSPTATATPPTVGSITISTSASVVAVNATVTVAGQLASPDGSPAAGQQVWLLERQVGAAGVSQVATGTTQADGRISLTTPPITHSVRLRLVTESKLRSAAIGVRLQPTIMATVSHSSGAGADAAILIATTGAAPGDSVTIEQQAVGGWRAVATNELDGTGMARFAVTSPTGRPDRYRAVLPRSPAHRAAVIRFVVTAD